VFISQGDEDKKDNRFRTFAGMPAIPATQVTETGRIIG
jgi:hypothetical protein